MWLRSQPQLNKDVVVDDHFRAGVFRLCIEDGHSWNICVCFTQLQLLATDYICQRNMGRHGHHHTTTLGIVRLLLSYYLDTIVVVGCVENVWLRRVKYCSFGHPDRCKRHAAFLDKSCHPCTPQCMQLALQDNMTPPTTSP